MRCDQPHGLCESAIHFLTENEAREKLNHCKHCGRFEWGKLEICGKYEGYNEHTLLRYNLKDGGKAEEFLQAIEFSSGPNLFLGLRVFPAGQPPYTIEWTSEEIEARL